MEQSKRGAPSRLWYVAGAAILVGGIGGGAWYAVSTVLSSVSEMQRFVIPGTHSFELAPGDYKLYYEHKSSVDGVVYRTDRTEWMRCSLHLGGQQVELSAPSMNETYSLGARAGESVAAFTASERGTYTLECESNGGPLVVAVGDVFSFTVIIIGIVVAFLSLMAGSIVIALTYKRRLDSSKPPRVVPPVGEPEV